MRVSFYLCGHIISITLLPQRSGVLDIRSELRFSHFTGPFTGSFGMLLVGSSVEALSFSGLWSIWGFLSISFFEWQFCWGFSFFCPFLLPLLILLWLQIYLQSCFLMAVGLGHVLVTLFYFGCFCLLVPRLPF